MCLERHFSPNFSTYGFSLDYLEVEAELQKVLTNYSPERVLPPRDGVLGFAYRQLVKLVLDCKTKCHHYIITSSYLQDLRKNIRILLQQAEERSQIEDLTLIKELANKMLCVIERLTRSGKRLKKAASNAIDGWNLNPDIRDPDTSQLGIKSHLIEGPAVLRKTDSGICETSEIDESSLIRSLDPKRKPCKSDYETLKPISSGAFGAIFLVRHKATKQLFAMEKLNKQHLTDRRTSRAFLERDILTFVDCPFVNSMLSSFPSKNHLCMVMEHVEVGDCRNLLEIKGHFPVTLARQYIAETVLAVEYLHSHGIVHRNLKPENLLITSTGHIKVTNLRASKLGLMRGTSDVYKGPTEDITNEFRERKIRGTPRYMAPEVIMKRGYGRPVDWWSVGIILHTFLVGSPPFTGKDKAEVYAKIIEDDVTWDPDTAPPRDAQDLILKLLRKDPTHRLGTGGAHEIKNHPFLRDLDFETILSQMPEYIPELVSDEDTNCSSPRSEEYKDPENEEDSSEDDDDESVFQYFTSSSHRLAKLYTTNTTMMDNEDSKSSPECPPAEDSELQEESSFMTYIVEPSPSGNDDGGSLHCTSDFEILSPSTFDAEKPSRSRPDAEEPSPSEEFPSRVDGGNERGDTNTGLPPLSASSEYQLQKKIKKCNSVNLKKEEQESVNRERESRPRGSIIRRFLSSCRRRLSRAARAIGRSRMFACCRPTSSM